MHKRQRFGWLIEEQNNIDFPYYNGKPITISAWKWLIVWIGTFIYLTLTFVPHKGPLLPPTINHNILVVASRIILTVIPLIVFRIIAGSHWKRIFIKPRMKDCRLMLLCAILSIVVASILGIIIEGLGFPTSDNRLIAPFLQLNTFDVIIFYIATAIQLLGEELAAILPFLGIMSVLHLNYGVSRKKALFWAWLFSSLWFGALHLQTYHWDVAQSLIVIGGARVALTLAFIRTKNIWVSTGAHIINDWAVLGYLMIMHAIK